MARSLVKLPIPLPIKGLNTVNPYVSFDSGYARELTNYIIRDGRLWFRPGVGSHKNDSGTNRHIHWFDIDAETAILDNGDIRNFDTGAGATSIGGSPHANATRVKHISLDLVFGCREPRLAIDPFTAWTFTTVYHTASAITCGCSHKGRLYTSDGDTVEYSALSAVTGAMSGSFQISDFMAGQKVVRIFSVSINPSITTENVFVAFGQGGRVLVYGGDYPGSATWSIIAIYDMPAPISNVGFVEIDGDIFVATNLYAYWFRDLFQGGPQTAYRSSPTLPIENIWAGAAWSSNYSFAFVSHSFYYPEIDAIITMASLKDGGPNNFSLLAEYQNSGAYFCYHRKYDAWSFWQAAPFYTPVITDADSGVSGYNTNTRIYAAGNKTEVKILLQDQYPDEYNSPATWIMSESSWKTPYLSPFKGQGLNLSGIRLNFRNPNEGYFEKIRAIFDYSDYKAPLGWYTQSMVTQINPGQYSESNLSVGSVAHGQYSKFVGLSGNGDSVSFQFTDKRTQSAGSGERSIVDVVAYLTPGADFI